MNIFNPKNSLCNFYEKLILIFEAIFLASIQRPRLMIQNSWQVRIGSLSINIQRKELDQRLTRIKP